MHTTNKLAENHIRITRPLFKEGMCAVESGAYKKSIQRIAAVLVVLYAAVALWLLYTGGSLFFLLGQSIFLGALLFWLFVMLPGTRYRSKYKALAGGAGDVPERTIRFFEHALSVTANTGKETVIPYSDVTGWQETEHLYLLTCRNNACVMLDKAGFLCGDFRTVCALLPHGGDFSQG